MNQQYIPLEEIRDDLLDVSTPEDRLELLIEFGDTTSDFPESDQIEANRVLGCQSNVWLTSRVRDQQIDLKATSDAPMVRGLIAILLSSYSGKSAREILSFPIEDFFTEIKLRSFLSPMRSNGLNSIIGHIRTLAAKVLSGQGNLDPRSIESAQDASNAKAFLEPAKPISPTRLIADCRKDFPILSVKLSNGQQVVYLDNAATSQRPQQVIEAMKSVYEQHFSNVHRAGHEMADATTRKMELARGALQRFIQAPSPEQVIFTSGTTASINLVARSWGDANIHSGDEILLTEMEHHSNIVPWQQLAQRRGAKIRWLPINPDFQLDRSQLNRFLSSKTKIVALTAVSNVLGTVNPVRAIADAAHAVGAAILVDAAQAVPHGGVDVIGMDADFCVFSGHKMLGPTGLGVLYGKSEILEAMPPFLGGGNMIRSVTFDGFEPAGLPHKFEAGTAPIVEAIGMLPAVEYLESIGSESIIEHERLLLKHAMERLSQIPRLRIYGPVVNAKTGVLSFSIDGMHGDEIGKLLDAKGIAIRVGHHCAMPLHSKLGVPVTCRASFYFYNTLEEVDLFADCLVAAVRRFGGN